MSATTSKRTQNKHSSSIYHFNKTEICYSNLMQVCKPVVSLCERQKGQLRYEIKANTLCEVNKISAEVGYG